ncbi:MAG: hypothetical protein RIR40_1019 [Actinomycetota bacterium]|jgi:uncharacterized membrane protein (UPF0182 family)
MTFGNNPENPFRNFNFPKRNPGERRRIGALPLTVIALTVLAVILVSLSGFYVDYLWFKSVEYNEVWTKLLTTRASLFVIFGLFTSLIIVSNILIAYKRRPVYVPTSLEADNLERYRAQIEPIKRAAIVGIALAIFYFAGTAGSRFWELWMLYRNATPFGVTDPQFNRDISFFMFTLPFWQALVGWAISTLILATIAATAVHYIYGGIRPQVREDRTTVTARVQLSILLGTIVAIKAVAYWLDRFALSTSDQGIITGLTFTDVNAVLPAKSILVGIAIICSLLFFANIIRRSWVLPAAGLALLGLSSFLIAGVYPALIQQFQVKPSESAKEAPFIQRNIESTRAAYGLDKVEIKEYEATTRTSAGQLAKDVDSISNIRLMDPNVLSATFRQLQQIKPYYTFNESLDIDRYVIDGKYRDMVVAIRELNIDGNPNRNWINDHLVYTHGFGLVGAYGNTQDVDGKPVFTMGDIPPKGILGDFEPRIYFGENNPEYSIIGGAKGSDPVEFDYPDDASPNGQKNYTYTGKGGVPMGSLFSRLLFAIHYQEQRILLSNLINSESKIIFNRVPRERVAKVAPWLKIDGDPYPAIVDGRVLWMIDGYTTSAGYPYSRTVDVSGATTDALNINNNPLTAVPNSKINYIRNSVKATVDAYDGTVTLYAWDEKDPLLQTWMKAFPGVVKAKSEMSEGLVSHVRYPEDIFRVQRDVLSLYHVKNANAFYGGQDFWRVPRDPSTLGANAGAQPPYYYTLKLPGEEKAAFSLTTPFVPRGGRENLSAFAVVNSDPGENYGKFTVLQLQRSTNIAGPSQVASNFEANPTVALSLSLLRQGGSDVVLGNLLTVPAGGGLLYVQPVYVRATANTAAYPLLQKVLVSFGEKIGFDDTLRGALDQVFGGDSGSTSTGTETPTQGSGTNGALAQALASAQRALADAQAALAKGDFAAYGQAQDRLKAAIEAAVNAQRR